MASDSALPPVIGAIADDRDGTPLGTVTAVFLDDVTGQPTWVGLTPGLHAHPDTDEVPVIAPVAGVDFTDGRLRLPVSAAAVGAAPRVAQPDRLTPAEETTLRAHYAGTRPSASSGTASDGAMTRAEEQLDVATVVEPWTRAVLRIEEVTEEVMVPVTVTRQRARIEHLPLTSRDSARDAGAPGTQRETSTGGWVTLYADEPVVTVERRPAERVRLATSWVTEQTTVSDQLRKEQVELTTTDTV
ncbi:PRC and DUF2382 domain-containing protein [uncultured Modestobacter sp.]|uniref:PRC and DUF2382 domain-containing protein n=1 Tax=uncultured Modestobacter sp. TaxID=380048 RepID=UPI00260ACA45|nr:PRC and DUF2382 domain-containing protein [uncultured Modestobacter sp.]